MLEDKITGFEKGTNDYVTKPFHIEELIARVNDPLRLDNKTSNKYTLQVGDLILYKNNSTLICTTTNDKIDVRCKEYLLIEYFMYNPT